MSLIITSSSEGLDETNQIGIARPEQYKNHLINSLMIEPDSEIAVESVKLNRLPMLDAGAGIVGNFWFGERLSKTKTLEKSLSYIIPTENEIGRSVTPVDFADKYINTLKEAYSLHPDIDSVNIEMTAQFGTSGAFTGYQYKIPQVGSVAGSLLPAATTQVGDPLNTNTGLGDDMTWDGATLTSQYTDQFGQLLPRGSEGGPISMNGGLLQYAKPTMNTFTFGLSRPYAYVGVDPSIGRDLFQNPEEVFKGKAPFGIGPDLDQYYDYALQVDTDDKLRIYHSVPSHTQGHSIANQATYPYDQGSSPNGETIMMSEIIYWNNADTAFTASNGSNSSHVGAGPLTWSTASGAIAFSTSGELMTISVSGTVISGNFLGSKQAAFNASYKSQIPKPIAQTSWKMYPAVGLWTKGNTAKLEKYNCRTEANIWNNQPENSWITKSTTETLLNPNGSALAAAKFAAFAQSESRTDPWNNAFSWGHSVDCRDLFRPLNSGSSVGGLVIQKPIGTTAHTYQPITAKVINDYENIFIVGQTERYMSRAIQQWQPNSGLILGFYPMGFSPLAGSMTQNVGASFVSAQRPSLMSQHTSFIRVPTFTHQTFNFGTGNPSKILFQVPRFDNAGTETGALYYQNNDKTYVDLNNATELRITDLDVHIVRKNETFVEDLTGSTEVVFHVRKKK